MNDRNKAIDQKIRAKEIFSFLMKNDPVQKLVFERLSKL